MYVRVGWEWGLTYFCVSVHFIIFFSSWGWMLGWGVKMYWGGGGGWDKEDLSQWVGYKSLWICGSPKNPSKI